MRSTRSRCVTQTQTFRVLAVVDRTVKLMSELLRAGQRAFNDLYLSDPAIADLIRGSEFDPFYDDTRLAVFRRRVEELRRTHGS